MRLLKRFSLVIAAIFVMALVIVPAAAELKTTQTDDGKTLISNGTYWISWDPIGDHIVGDQFFINGTTNLSAGADLYYSFLAPSGGCHTKICSRKSSGTDGDIIIKTGPKLGINTFSVSINTTDFQSNWFVFLFKVISSDTSTEVNAFHQESLMDSTIFLFPEIWRSIITQSRITHPDTGISYWISFNKMDYTGPCYQLTGTTNLPIGETLSYSFFSPVEFGVGNNIDPIRDVQGPYYGGMVVSGEKSGINRFIIPVNSLYSANGTNIIVWNPRYNTSVYSDSISSSTDFHPLDPQNVSNCSVAIPVTTPASPISFIGTCAALFGFLCICLMTKRKEK